MEGKHARLISRALGYLTGLEDRSNYTRLVAVRDHLLDLVERLEDAGFPTGEDEDEDEVIEALRELCELIDDADVDDYDELTAAALAEVEEAWERATEALEALADSE
jgi:DNA-binding FadR family transcriptional regulator